MIIVFKTRPTARNWVNQKLVTNSVFQTQKFGNLFLL